MASMPRKNYFSMKEKEIIKKNYKKILICEKKILDQLNIIKNFKYELLHRDLHPHNILINGKKVYLMDIDSIVPTKWPIAIGFAVFKLIRQFCVKNKITPKNIGLMSNFINILLDSSKISGMNYKILFLGGKIEILRRIIVIMEGNLNGNISPWNKVLEMQIKALSEIEYLEEKLV